MQDFDVYSGWIVANINGAWRKVHVSAGWVTLADWLSPNDHIGVFTEAKAAKAINSEEADCQPIGQSRYALIADIVRDPDVLDRIATVRFGRVPTGEKRYAFIEDHGLHLLKDRDDRQGIDPSWGRYPQPTPQPFEVAHRWDRLLKGPINVKFRED